MIRDLAYHLHSLFTITCGQCGAVGEPDGAFEDDAAGELFSQGWTIKDGRPLCPECGGNDPAPAPVQSAGGSGQHTSGPWRPTTSHGIDCKEPFMVWADAIGAAVAHVYNRSEAASQNHAVQAANARLIAAAPDLLAALRALVHELDPNGAMVDPDLSSHRPVIAARAAIAKAEGGAA